MSKSVPREKESSSDNSPELVRTTLIIPATLHKNLTYLCAVEGINKTDAVTQALANYLRERGLQPDKSPKFVIEY